MKATAAGRCARAVVSAAAGRGNLEEAVGALARAAAFFGTEDGRLAARVLQSSRSPAAEREALQEEVARALELPREAAAVVEALASGRALRALRAVAARASSLGETFGEVARVEIRTAMALPEGASARVGSAMERILGRPVRVEVVEDAGVIAGVVVKVGDRIWDGSLRGRLVRAREALAADGAPSVA